MSVFQANKSDIVIALLMSIVLILLAIDKFAGISVSLERLAAVLAVISLAILIGDHIAKNRPSI